MPPNAPRITGPLPTKEAGALNRALADSADVTVFVDGTAYRLPPAARDGVLDLLQRLAAGSTVQCSSVTDFLTTSQAAELAGISPTYLRNLTDAGDIPVEYRGSHRRFRRGDIEEWLRHQGRSAAGS